MSDRDAIPTHPFTRGLVHRTARRLGDDPLGIAWDVEDFEQELLLRLLAGLFRFDPDRGSGEGFATTVLGRATSRIRRDCGRVKRNGRPLSLDDAEVAEVADTSDAFNVAQNDLRLDVIAALSGLSPDLRVVAGVLMHADGLADAARQCGMARSSLQRKVARLRDHFTGVGVTP